MTAPAPVPAPERERQVRPYGTEAAMAVAVVMVGVVVAGLALTGTHARFVREGMRWPLVAGGVVLVVIGAYGHRRQRLGLHDDHGHGHSRPSRVGWCLLVPVAALAIVNPSPLGLGATNVLDGDDQETVEAAAGLGSSLDPLPEGDVVDIEIDDFLKRAKHDTTFSGRTVRLSGFVRIRRTEGYDVSRFKIFCCAADAVLMGVRIQNGPTDPVKGTWLEVTGRFVPGDSYPPVLEVEEWREIVEPADPYLHFP